MNFSGSKPDFRKLWGVIQGHTNYSPSQFSFCIITVGIPQFLDPRSSDRDPRSRCKITSSRTTKKTTELIAKSHSNRLREMFSSSVRYPSPIEALSLVVCVYAIHKNSHIEILQLQRAGKKCWESLLLHSCSLEFQSEKLGRKSHIDTLMRTIWISSENPNSGTYQDLASA